MKAVALRIVIAVISLFNLLQAEPTQPSEIRVGEFEIGSDGHKKVWDVIKAKDFYALVDGHSGISILNQAGDGWIPKAKLNKVRDRISESTSRNLAVVLLGKGYVGSGDPNERHSSLVELLLEERFVTVIVLQAHSRFTIVSEVHRNSESGRNGD
ncbi:hypothetical protein VSU19_16205 [Verrucomicrobiales bacterium BCK34]|nr:hypothetical protein [Verrucomicrobiales bacterium BCK34]